MAQLKSLLVTGAARFINIINGDISGNAATATKLETSRTLQTNLASTSTASFDGSANASPGVTGTLGVGNGGTGQTTAKNAANAFMNALDTGSSTPVDADYYISQYVGGGTTTTTYHRRPMSALWSYISGKISSVLGLTASAYGGTAATATNVSTQGAASNSTARHVWFSDSTTETKRAHSDNLKYTPSTNIITANISGDAATVTGHTVASNVPANAVWLPAVTTSDNGKVLRVVSGSWSAVNLPSASGVSF